MVVEAPGLTWELQLDRAVGCARLQQGGQAQRQRMEPSRDRYALVFTPSVSKLLSLLIFLFIFDHPSYLIFKNNYYIFCYNLFY
jgi:hypothetical protein